MPRSLESTQEKSTFNQSDLSFDRSHIWHPYTSLTNPLPTYEVASAHGVRIKLANGAELVDGMASWWTAIHGYNVPELNEAARQQLDKMAHVMFGGITHGPAISLAKKLVDITPKGLDKVFFSDSGSVSVEVAMKMAVQYQHARGFPERTKFMTFKRGYHGDTSGAMSVCDPENGMHHLFSSFLPQHFFVEAPQNDFSSPHDEQEIASFEQIFKERSQESAAFILEPIAQGAGGMRFYSPDYLREVKRLCNKYELLLIADEIATGFGRTGKLFACEHASVSPDIICVGKALTGGYISLAATLCTNYVAETICNGEAGVFMHGPTFMGNPLSCSIASRSIELLLASPWKERINNIQEQLIRELSPASKLPGVSDVRVLGAIGVVEMIDDVDVTEAQRFFVKEGVWIRPFKNLIYIMPPYITPPEDLTLLTKAIVNYCSKQH